MTTVELRRWSEADLPALSPLVEQSLAEGWGFVERLYTRYCDGSNRFEQPGEVLLGAWAADALVGIGGLNRDPYSQDASLARVRHLYVVPAWRRHGVGRLLVEALVAQARAWAQAVVLRTNNPAAASFYTALGFVASPVAESTHWLAL